MSLRHYLLVRLSFNEVSSVLTDKNKKDLEREAGISVLS